MRISSNKWASRGARVLIVLNSNQKECFLAKTVSLKKVELVSLEQEVFKALVILVQNEEIKTCTKIWLEK